MSNKPDDVFEKFDALVNKHTRVEPDFPVLTDIIEPPRVDLDAIPVLTEEINPDAPTDIGLDLTPDPAPADIELELIPEPAPIDAVLKHAQTQEVLGKLELAEAEIQAEVEARIQRSLTLPETPIAQAAPSLIDIPNNAHYIGITDTVAPPAGTPPVTLAPEATAREIAGLLEADIAAMVKSALRQALAEELPGMMHTHLDKALSSLLDQHIMMLAETVRASVADEFAKQIAPFRRQPPTPKP